MILGVRAHDFGRSTVEELAGKISAKGFTRIQLAMTKAVSGINTGDGRLNPGLAGYVREVFAKSNIGITVLGCYYNIAHPDENERKAVIERFKEHIRYVRDFGCSIVGTETGSVNADYSFNPENHSEKALATVIASVKEMVAEAERFGVLVCIEGVTRHVVHTPEKLKRVLDTVNSNNLQIIFDPVNLIDESNYKDQDKIITDSFDLFGDRLAAIHSKDFIIENGVKKLVQVGKGIFNYELLLKLLKDRKPYINVLFEGANPETVNESADYLNAIYNRV